MILDKLDKQCLQKDKSSGKEAVENRQANLNRKELVRILVSTFDLNSLNGSTTAFRIQLFRVEIELGVFYACDFAQAHDPH